MSAATWTAAASVLVALIAAGSAELSRRAAAKASRENKAAESRTEIEKAAFERAEGMLDRQYKRQEEEIEGLHADVDRLKREVEELQKLREQDRLAIASRDEQIRTYAALLAARGIDLP